MRSIRYHCAHGVQTCFSSMTEGSVSVSSHPMHVHVQASCVFHEQLVCLTTLIIAVAYAQPEK